MLLVVVLLVYVGLDELNARVAQIIMFRYLGPLELGGTSVPCCSYVTCYDRFFVDQILLELRSSSAQMTFA